MLSDGNYDVQQEGDALEAPVCSFDQLNSEREFYTWCWESKKKLWAIMWKDVVPLISISDKCHRSIKVT